MNKEFIPYKLAVKLVELGFNQKCFDVYSDMKYHVGLIPRGKRTPKILYQQAFRFFREKYGLTGWVQGKTLFMYCIESIIPTDGQLNLSPFKTYEKAEIACLEKLIEIAEKS